MSHGSTGSIVHLETTAIFHITHIQPLAAILAGVLILFVPRILNYVVAAYLILVGILGLGLIR